MHNFGTFFLWALAASILRQGSFANDQSGYICLIEDPKQNQCDSICLTELSPRLSEVVKAQNQGNTNTRDAVNEIKSKLERLEVKIGQVQAKLPQEVYAKLEGRLQGVEAKLEVQLQEVQTKLEAKLEESLLAVKTKLEGQQTVLTEMEDFQTKLDESLLALQTKLGIQLQAVVNQLQTVLEKINAADVAVQDSATIIIPSGFELIGNRYFRIVNEYANWETAEKSCREMGGYLASFRNEEEFNVIIPKLIEWKGYWLGINDQDNEGDYVSVASHKPAQFVKWYKGAPSDRHHMRNCVLLVLLQMADNYCNNKYSFICQADNEF